VEAKGKGISVEAFLRQAVDQKLPPWHIKELEGYYLAQKDRINKPLDTVREDTERAFLKAKWQQARQEYIAQLEQRAGVVVLLNRPKLELAANASRVRGNPDAPVTIVEFADFQCPYCQSVQPILRQLMDKYNGKVRLGFRDFPLKSIHPQAQLAAEASRCAEEQGKFWEYHDLLLANQSALNPEAYRQHARSAGLDGQRFEACLASGKLNALIESDVQSGVALGILGTPAFYIDGVLMRGWQPVSAFEKIIESQLSITASGKPVGER